MAINGQNSEVIGTLKGAPLKLGSKKITIDFLVVDQSPYDVILGDSTMER